MSIRIDYAPMNNAPTTADSAGDRMSEYIATEFDLASTEFISEYEEIVRCSDCRHFNGYHNKCHRQQGAIVVLGDIVRIDEQKERLVLTDAEPDGFCKWAVRRNA